MKTIYHSLFYVSMFCLIIFFGVKCQEDSNISVTNPIEKIMSKDHKKIGTKCKGFRWTLFIPVAWWAKKVYPNVRDRVSIKQAKRISAVFS